MRIALSPVLLASVTLAATVAACEGDGADQQPLDSDASEELADGASGSVPVLTFDPTMVLGALDATVLDAEATLRDAAPLDAGRDATTARDAGLPDASFACTGVATSCSLLTVAQCTSVSGCSVEGDCTGVSSSCYSQYYSSSCIGQEGCFWSSSNSRCSGSSWSCSLFSGRYTCVDQKGCSWREDCAGVVRSCSSNFSQVSCTAQPGCSWSIE